MKFEDFKEPVRYGRACPKGHVDSTGGVRIIKSGHCLACRFKLPNGLFSHTLTVEPKPPHPNLKYQTPEEARAAHAARVGEWNKRNPDSFQATQQRYRENNAEALKARSAERYKNFSAEKKAAIVARGRERYKNMTPERKAMILEKQRAKYQARKQKLQDCPLWT